MEASQLYMNERVPRSLKQCIAIGAERLVAWQGIQAYLAGVGARVLWARIAPENSGTRRPPMIPPPPREPAARRAPRRYPEGGIWQQLPLVRGRFE